MAFWFTKTFFFPKENMLFFAKQIRNGLGHVQMQKYEINRGKMGENCLSAKIFIWHEKQIFYRKSPEMA